MAKKTKTSKRVSVFAATRRGLLGSASGIAMDAHGAMHARKSIPRNTVAYYKDGEKVVVGVDEGDNGADYPKTASIWYDEATALDPAVFGPV